METTKVADKLITELVKLWEKSAAELEYPGFGVDEWDLAAYAGILKKSEVQKRRNDFRSNAIDDLPSVAAFMKQKGWIRIIDQGEYGVVLLPTPQGVEYVKGKRSMCVRFMNALGSSAKTIIVAIITSAITTLVVYFILKWLGENKTP